VRPHQRAIRGQSPRKTTKSHSLVVNFVNETGVEAGWNPGFQPGGREVVVIVIKATYDLASISDPRSGLGEVD